MQATRQQILTILHEKREATVEQVVKSLRQMRGDRITAVTVRHHLNVLQEDGMVDVPQTRQQNNPGRPRHIYTLTERGSAYFPNNYQRLASGLLEQLQEHVPAQTVNVILEGVADEMAKQACIPEGTCSERLNAVVSYLNDCGYQASWEEGTGGYLLYMQNCPYHGLTHENDHLCRMDVRLITKMLGVIPRLQSQIAHHDERCCYFIPQTNN